MVRRDVRLVMDKFIAGAFMRSELLISLAPAVNPAVGY